MISGRCDWLADKGPEVWRSLAGDDGGGETMSPASHFHIHPPPPPALYGLDSS